MKDNVRGAGLTLLKASPELSPDPSYDVTFTQSLSLISFILGPQESAFAVALTLAHLLFYLVAFLHVTVFLIICHHR